MSFSLSLLTILFLNITIQNEKILTCYYTNWAVYRRGNAKYNAEYMYPYLCTHIIYAFANIDAQTLTPVPTDPWSDLPDGLDNFRKVTSLKNINPNLKVFLSVGGWERLLSEFQLVSSNEENSRLFAKNTKNYLKKYNFDGFDVDWEYPNDKAKYTRMMKALSEEFKRDSTETYLLTAAVSAGIERASVSYDIPTVSKYLDYINIMTYDFYGQFSRVVGHHSGLYCLNENDRDCTDFSVRYWHSQGTPLSKILIGIPTYAQGFKTTSKNPRVGDVKVGGTPMGHILYNSGILSYLEYCNEGYKNVWDDTQKVAHGEKDYYWLGYETIRSIHEKANYVKDNGLAGMFVWTLDFDDFTGKECHNGKSPLIGAIHKELNIYPGIDWETNLNTGSTYGETTSTKSSISSNSDVVVSDKNNICKSIGFAPLDGCTKYMNCAQIGSTGFVQSCGSGLLFDVKTSTCNWNFLVLCDSSDSRTNSNTEKETINTTTNTTTEEATTVKSTKNEPTTEKTSTTTEFKSDGDVFDSVGNCKKVGHFALDGCQKFVFCVNVGYRGYISKCSNGLLFDDKAKVCNFKALVSCKTEPITTQGVETKSATASIKTKSYKQETTHEETTTTEELTTSVKTSTTEEQSTKSNGSDNIDSDGKCMKVGYFAVDGCKKFVLCGYVGQRAYPVNCPGNLIFDETRNYCNYPNMVVCRV